MDRNSLDQEESICRLCLRPSKRGGTPIRWKSRLTNMRVQPVRLGDFIGREGSYVLNRKQGVYR